MIQPAEFWSRPPIRTSRLERIGGASLFLVVTAFWIFGLVSDEQGSIAYEDFVVLIAAGLSALSLVITGYLLGRWVYALWFVWIPGAAMTAAGFWMNPTPGGDETGGALIFLGPLVALFGGLYFVPLIALGVCYAVGERRLTRAYLPQAHGEHFPLRSAKFSLRHNCRLASLPGSLPVRTVEGRQPR